MMKSHEALARGIAKEARVVAITGEEDFLREQIAEMVKRDLPEDVEVTLIEGGDGLELRDLLDDLRTRGLFGGDRLIHVRGADAFLKEHAAALTRFLEEGEAVQRLIVEGKALMGKGRKTVPKTGILAAIERIGGVVVACDTLFDSPFKGRGPAWQSPLSKWVVERSSFYGKRLSMEDAYALHRMVGNKLRELDAELKKLATFVKDAPRITADDIERCVGEGRLAPVFDLAESIGSRQVASAVEHSQMLFERGLVHFSGRHIRDLNGIAIMIVSATTNVLRKIARVQEMMADGDSFEDAASAVRQSPFFRDRLRAQVDAWRDRDALRKALLGLREVERGLKSGAGGPRILFDRFLVTCVGTPRSAVAAARGGGGRSWRR